MSYRKFIMFFYNKTSCINTKTAFKMCQKINVSLFKLQKQISVIKKDNGFYFLNKIQYNTGFVLKNIQLKTLFYHNKIRNIKVINLINILKFNLNSLLRKLYYFIKNQAFIVISLIPSLDINNITFVLNTILIILFYAPLIYIFNFFFYIYFFYYCYESYLIIKQNPNFNNRKITLKFNYILLKLHIYSIAIQDIFTKFLIFFFIFLKFKIILKILLFKYISSLFCFLILYAQAKFIRELIFIYSRFVRLSNNKITDFRFVFIKIKTGYYKYKNLPFFTFIFLSLDLIFLFFFK
jgi:hypothetical protein